MNEIRSDVARLLTKQARSVELHDMESIFERITATAVCGNDSICLPVPFKNATSIIRKLSEYGFDVRHENLLDRKFGEDATILYVAWRVKYK